MDSSFELRRIPYRTFGVTIAMVAVAALVLGMMGRDLWGVTGQPGLWTGEINSRLNSQRLADPYTFTHVTHGVVFWLIGWWLLRHRFHAEARMNLAVAVEAAWEVVENTPYVIERFREATLAQGYYGDSILNAVGDMTVMVAGYLLAAWLSVRLALAAFVVLEVALALWIRDNLFLNVLMLLYPIEGLREWQLQAAWILSPTPELPGWDRGP